MKETVAVRGVPNKGPIVAWIKTMKTRAKTTPSGRPMSKTPSARVMAIAMTDKSGNKTPVTKNPAAAPTQWLPANWPRCSGKIRFPAPKKRPNNSEATTKYWRLVSFGDVRSGMKNPSIN